MNNNSQQLGVARMRSVVGRSKRPRTAPQVEISSHRVTATRVYPTNAAASALRRISRWLRGMADMRRTLKMSIALRRLMRANSFWKCRLCLILVIGTNFFSEFSLSDGSLGPDWQYQCNVNNNGCYSQIWVDTMQAVGEQQCTNGWPQPGYQFNWTTMVSCSYQDSLLNMYGEPYVTVLVTLKTCGSVGCPGPGPSTIYTNQDSFFPRLRYNPAAYFLKADVQSNSQPLSCCQNKVGHPIDPVSSAAFDVLDDLTGGNAFHRFYSSQNAMSTDFGPAWNHDYQRKVVVKYSALYTQLYSASTKTSSAYADPATACTNGFAELQAKVPNWIGASALYANGNCQLTNNGVPIGSAPIYYTRQTLPLAATPVVYDLTRDDGQLIRFTVINGVITAPPGTSLQLAQTSNGFTVTDGNDNTERYDVNGKLLSVTSRSGVVQTMSYDGSGRLSSVVDSFGHQLILTYDATGKLSSVTRQ